MKKTSAEVDLQIKEEQHALKHRRNFGINYEKKNLHGVTASLTEEEIKEIDEFWSKYRFAYPKIGYESFAGYKALLGKSNPRICPTEIKAGFMMHVVNESMYRKVLHHKCMLPFLYREMKQPQAVVIRMNGFYLDKDYQPITLSQAVDICLDFLKQEEHHGIVAKKMEDREENRFFSSTRVQMRKA